MPSGIVHRKITTILIPLTTPTLFIDGVFGLGVISGIIVTLAVNPDLDITTNKAGVFHSYFEWYKDLIPHRYGLRASHWEDINIWKLLSFSHLPIFGTLLRYIMVFLPIMLISYAYGLSIGPFFGGALLGMIVSDICHICADVIVSLVKGKINAHTYRGGKVRRRRTRLHTGGD